jgi:hypothetical protein
MVVSWRDYCGYPQCSHAAPTDQPSATSVDQLETMNADELVASRAIAFAFRPQGSRRALRREDVA